VAYVGVPLEVELRIEGPGIEEVAAKTPDLLQRRQSTLLVGLAPGIKVRSVAGVVE
jgi:hypothetical protein